MMMGGGYYGNGVSSSSSSNLSAAAPPFTVDRSVPKPFSPLIDFTDQTYHLPVSNSNSGLHNWLPSNSSHDFFSIDDNNGAVFEPIPSSIDYTNSPKIPHVATLNPASRSADDGHHSHPPPIHPEPSNPYHQPFISSDTSKSMLPRQSGHGILSRTHAVTPLQPSGDICFPQTLDHTSHWKGLWNSSDWLQNSQVKLDDGCFVAQDNYMNEGSYAPKKIFYGEGFNGTDVVGSEKNVKRSNIEQMDYQSVLCENPKFVNTDYPTALTCTATLAGESGGYVTPFSASLELGSRKQSPSAVETHLVTKLPSVTIKPPHQDMFSHKTMRPWIGEGKEFGCVNPVSIKEAHPDRKAEGKPDLDTRQLRLHLGKSQEELTSNTSIFSEGPFIAKPGLQVPRMYPDGFSVLVDNKSLNSADNIAENLAHHSSALDSPCWKGASISHRSGSEVARSYDLRKVEDFSGTNLLGPEVSPFTPYGADLVNPQNSGDCETHNAARDPEECLGPFKEQTGASASIFSGEGIGCGMKLETHNTTVSCSPGVQSSDGICTLNNGDDLFRQSVETFDGEAPKKQITGEGQGTTVKHAWSNDPETNKSDYPEYWSSHVSFHAIEQVLLSPPSAESSPTLEKNKAECRPSELTRPSNRKSAPYVYIKTLVNSMHDLSELLLLHCSNEACELAEEDCETLKEVLKNVHSSLMNKAEEVINMEKLLIPKRQRQFCAFRKGPNVEASQYQGLGSGKLPSPVQVQRLQEYHSTLDGLRDENLLNHESVKHASVTQAIKKILTESLHNEVETQPDIILYKNLWLEAEAELCSVNHVARYNRMRMEMENGHSQQLNVLPERTTAMRMFGRPEISSDISAQGTMGLDINSRQVVDTPDSDTSISSASSNSDDTLARSHVLKSPVGKSVAAIFSVAGKISDHKEAGKATLEVKDSAKTDVFVHESHRSRNIGHTNDVDASVMARFQILKCRAGSLNSTATEEHQPEGADLGYPGLRDNPSTCKEVLENIPKNGKVKTSLPISPVKCTEEHVVIEDKCNKRKGHGTMNVSTTNVDPVSVPLESHTFYNTSDHPDVSSRFFILKSRDEKHDSKSTSDVEKSSSPVISPCKVNLRPLQEKNDVTGSEDTYSVEQLHLRVRDAPAVPHCFVNMPGYQSHSSYQESSSSSDWEHVLKEEVTGEK
ncbi:unnamed protein product [Linum trigynum]|uniref:Uncharacterized protein n=1 Tax=Linum trigynum TaxID=586398 RepID=A0AAV2CXA0_9ROSI